MAKVPKISPESVRRQTLASGLCGLTGLGLLAVAPACLPPVPDSPPATIKHAVLVCADSDHDLFAELKPRFTRFEVSNMAENPECTRGKAAAGEVGHTCFADEATCSTPRFVDGKPIETPTSAYDLVLLFPQLLHGSLTAKTVTTTRTVTSGGGPGALSGGASAGRGAARGGGRGKTVTENELVASPETDYTGEVLVFEPRPGTLHPGKRFKNLAPEPLRDRLLELLQR